MELETYKCVYQKSEMHTAQCSEVKTANHCINAWQPVLTSADVSFTQSRSGQVTHVTLKTWAKAKAEILCPGQQSITGHTPVTPNTI